MTAFQGLAFIFIIALCRASAVAQFRGIAIENVTFTLYTRENPSGSRVIVRDSSTLGNTSYDPNLPTKLVVHGWMNDGNSECIQLLKRDFLALEPMNVFGVGWAECSHLVLYEKTLVCAEQVGTYMGQLVKWLSETTGLSPSNVHAVGHSLGGHIVSYISKVIQIARITGADPAGPLFQHVDALARLDSSDAQFVEAFHTSTAILGIKTPVGHVDFFPNGGVKQPGCEDLFGDCAHGTSYKFYGYTVAEGNRQAYKAFKCESVEEAKNQSCTDEPTQIMGYGASLETRGIYYLNIPSVP